MAFDLTHYLRLRPYSYHLTDSRNLPSLQRTRSIRPCIDWLRLAGREHEAVARRSAALTLEIGDLHVVLKDQRPLVLKNARFDGGWAEADYMRALASMVFFWPGNESGPIRSGSNLIQSYQASETSLLRIETASLFAINAGATPLFCAYNSGAPRMQSGQPVPRGPDLFLPCDRFARQAAEVVELVFDCAITLPADTQVKSGGNGWEAL